MVVVLIMGLFAGLVSVIVQPDQRELLDLEARRLAQLLDLAAAEARFTGNSLAWTATNDTYGFLQLSEEAGWVAVRDNDALRPRQLPEGMLVSALLVENSPVAGAMRVDFPANGQTTAFSVALEYGAARCHVTVSPIGEVRIVQDAEEVSDAK